MRPIDRLREHLDTGGSVTVKSAWTILGIRNVSRYIGLLEAEGYPVKKKRLHTIDAVGDRVWIMHYSKKE